MKPYFLLFIIIICYTIGRAQDCTGKDLSKIPGTWKLSPQLKGSNVHLPEMEAKEKPICDRIIALIRSNFKHIPLGGDIFYDNVYNLDAYHSPKSVYLKKTGYAYEASFRLLPYECNHGRLEHVPGSLLYMYITINQIPFQLDKSFFVSRMDKGGIKIDQDPETDMYGLAPSLPDASKPYWDYTDDKMSSNGHYEGHTIDQYRMLFKPGKLPFMPMSKKEYFEKSKKYYRLQIQQKLAVLEANSAEFKKIEGGAKILEQQREEARADELFITKIDEILKSKSTEELSKPAIFGEEQGEYFSEFDPKMNQAYIIKVNPSYHNPALPLYSPQVITIRLNYFKHKIDDQADWEIYGAGVYKELERIKIWDLLTKELQPLIAQ